MYKERYFGKKKEILSDNKFNKKNREFVDEFLENKEYELKRKNNLPALDEASYKTLYFYVGKITNINKWFKNKTWSSLTEEDIKKLIDDLEDGVIKTRPNKKNPGGKRYSDRAWYYQILKGELFELAGKAHIAARMCKKFGIKGRIYTNDVRYITEEDFRKMVECVSNPTQKCLMWLAFDIGENIGSLIELKKEDFMLQTNEDTRDQEYKVLLKKDILKRSRTPRPEITNYSETVELLKIVLNNLKPAKRKVYNRAKGKCEILEYPEDKVFKFGLKTAQRFLETVGERAGVKCIPNGENVTWKDLRSSMACDLLNKDWTTDEINMRLGHRPSSRVIDKYVTFLAKDRTRPKKKVYNNNLRKIEGELEENKELNKLQSHRIEELKKQGEVGTKEREYLKTVLSMIMESKIIKAEFNKNCELAKINYP